MIEQITTEAADNAIDASSFPKVPETVNEGFSPNLNTLIEIAEGINGVSYAVAEFIDNASDASAEIVSLEPEEKNGNLNLFIKDNGRGMSLGLLKDAITLGSSKKASHRTKTLGCKGMGLNSASYYLCEELVIFTKTIDGKLSFGKVDFAYLSENRYTNHWDRISSVSELTNEILLSNSSYEKAMKWLEKHDSGTVVYLKKTRTSRIRNQKSLKNMLTRSSNSALSLSYIYRWKLNPEFSIFFDGDKITPTGPGFDYENNQKKDHVYFLNESDNGWITHTVCITDGSKYDVKMRFVHIGEIQSSNKGGVRILRFGRDVTPQLLRGFWSPNYNLGHLVVELDCPAAFLDGRLSFGIDKVINGIIDQNPEEFEFQKHFRVAFAKRLAIISAHNISTRRSGDLDQGKPSTIPEALLVYRFQNLLINSYKLQGKTNKEINETVSREYPLSNFLRADLKNGDKYYEFKNNSKPAVVSQVFTYLSALPNLESYTIVVPKVTSALKKMCEMLLSEESGFVRRNGVPFKIEFLDLSQSFPALLSPEKTSDEVKYLNGKKKKK